MRPFDSIHSEDVDRFCLMKHQVRISTRTFRDWRRARNLTAILLFNLFEKNSIGLIRQQINGRGHLTLKSKMKSINKDLFYSSSI